MYLNGVSVSTRTTSYTSTIGNVFYVGCAWYATDRDFQGYISDARLVKGTAVYTATFIPPTEGLTAISGSGYDTSLLACSLPYIADGSGNHTVTANGNTHTKRFGPYTYSNYSASSNGASVYFDGSGDYLTIASGASELDLGTGDFTIESWVYPEEISTNYPTFLGSVSGWNAGASGHRFDNTGYAGKFWFGLNGAGGVSNGDPFMASANTYPHNVWYHYVITRSGNTWRMFVNGNLQEVQTYSGSYNLNYGGTRMGYSTWDGGNGYYKGFVSDLRVVKGSIITAYQTSSTTEGDQIFTPPTSPLTAVANTQLLTCNDAPNVFNAAGSSNEITLVGNTQSSTAQKKHASASMLFDGSGDAITIGDDINLDFGSDPFTWEGWYRADDVSGDRYIISMSGGTFNAGPSHVGVNFYNGNWRAGGFNDKYAVGTTGIETNVWHHFALCHNNRQLQFYIDGTQVGNTIDVTSDTFDCGGNFRIGSFHSNTGSGNWDGYLEDIRISKGLSRYPFIPFSTTLSASDVSGTQLLACHAASVTTEGTGGLTINTTSTPTVTDFGPHPE